jgi:hypothetical protein
MVDVEKLPPVFTAALAVPAIPIDHFKFQASGFLSPLPIDFFLVPLVPRRARFIHTKLARICTAQWEF